MTSIMMAKYDIETDVNVKNGILQLGHSRYSVQSWR